MLCVILYRSWTEDLVEILLGSSLTGPCMKILQLPCLTGATGNRKFCMKILWAPPVPLYRSIEGPAVAVAVMPNLICYVPYYSVLYVEHWLPPTPHTVWGLLPVQWSAYSGQQPSLQSDFGGRQEDRLRIASASHVRPSCWETMLWHRKPAHTVIRVAFPWFCGKGGKKEKARGKGQGKLGQSQCRLGTAQTSCVWTKWDNRNFLHHVKAAPSRRRWAGSSSKGFHPTWPPHLHPPPCTCNILTQDLFI